MAGTSPAMTVTSNRIKAVASNEPAITPELVAEHGLKPDEYARLEKLIGRPATTYAQWAAQHADAYR